MVRYIKDKLRNEIYAVIFTYKNNLMMINAETTEKPWVVIRWSDVHPDEIFYEVPCGHRGQ